MTERGYNYGVGLVDTFRIRNSLFRRLGGQLRRPGASWRKNCAQGRQCYVRCTILPRLNSLQWSVLRWSVGFGSLLYNRRKDTTKFRKLAIFSKKSVQIFSSKAASAAAGWPSGGRNEYFCRPHHLKEAKINFKGIIKQFVLDKKLL